MTGHDFTEQEMKALLLEVMLYEMAGQFLDKDARATDWERDRLALVTKYYAALFNDESGVDVRLAAVEKMDREEGKA